MKKKEVWHHHHLPEGKEKGWYHDSSIDGFGGILHSDDFKYHSDQGTYDADFYNWGPFKTFSEAKQDAISYFQTDVISARNSIRCIKAFKKVRVDK